jgi:two-component system, cell cycle sensor histidine kinase and response regulator CckA
MNGRELADRLQESRPDLRVLYMSGYTANVIAHRGVLEEGLHFMQKPFSLEKLAEKVRAALDDRRV